MDELDQTLLLTALQNGIGFTQSCALNLFHPKTVSEYIYKNKEFHLSCIKSIKAAARGNLEHAQRLKNEKKFGEWHKQQDYIRNFITELTLWEAYTTKKDITVDKVMRACHIYNNLDECATACGLTRQELIEYIMSNAELAEYLTETSTYNF